ncbi:TetR/AcrR family transcriptional regulator [Quisquiliibacterium transsilvanicum]|uniref:AcrR family transcriptional regulator n=1 Tax=Quisquiliibacterium transsilvanicum TaxID=1549638 RepID=A0A7W8HLE5_9BURK|nr:TetR/AcrR family transcriptional regulator [Quisquiliibacterium transsilvanicum]MBB5273278.1 AcrR family transcriptional regulator [Quisquiliibacterium transsilvanicum]
MPAPRSHLPADARREITVEAVLALAAEQNPTDITTAAIARRMGLTQGAIFRHFPTKEALLESVMEWVADRLTARLDQARAAAPDPLAALEAMFIAHVDFIAEHPGVPRLLLGELQRAEDTPAKRIARDLLAGYGAHIAALLEQLRERGGLRAGLATADAVVAFIGAIQGLAMQSLIAGDIGRIRAQAPAVFEIYRRGTGA